MKQIEKLRTRLKNVGKSAQEYKMTIAEATELLSEIDQLKKSLEEKSQQETVKVIEQGPKPKIRIIDGGTF